MVMNRFSLPACVLASILFLAALPANAGTVLPLLSCEHESAGSRPVIVNRTEIKDTAYSADPMKQNVIFYPRVAARLPEPVVKLEFAKACLEALALDNGTCESVGYLRRRNLLSSFEVEELRRHFLSSGPKNEETYQMVKQLYDCY